MTRRNEWEEFFDGHAPVYMNNTFTKNTVEEVNFVLEELKLPPGSRILDMGCGTSRHAMELARRGYWSQVSTSLPECWLKQRRGQES